MWDTLLVLCSSASGCPQHGPGGRNWLCLLLTPCLWPRGLQGRARMSLCCSPWCRDTLVFKALFGEGVTHRFYLLKELDPVSLESKLLSSFAGTPPTACTPSLGSQL